MLADICIGLKSLELPVLLALEVFKFVCAWRNLHAFAAERAPLYWKIASTVKAREVWLVSRERMQEWILARKRLRAAVLQQQRANWSKVLCALHRFLHGDGSAVRVAVDLTRDQRAALCKILERLCIDCVYATDNGFFTLGFAANDKLIL